MGHIPIRPAIIGNWELSESQLPRMRLVTNYRWETTARVELGLSCEGRRRLVLSLLCILALAACYWLWHLGARASDQRYGWQAVLRVGCLIGAVRIGALWIGAAAFRDPGWPQGFGYFLQMLALPEIYLTRNTRADLLKWEILGSMLLAVTSFLWAALAIWIAGRLRPRDETPR